MAQEFQTLAIIRAKGAKMMHSTMGKSFAGAAPKVALVTSGSVGWKTIRYRWERDLADLKPTMHHIEDHARKLSDFAERYGAKSVAHALAGRAACNEALDAGAQIVLLTTLQNAPFAPLRKGVRYIVYGDCTSAQLSELYGGKKLRFPGSLVVKRLRQLADHGAIFLCASDWYRRALREELAIDASQMLIAPLYVDTDSWRPAPEKQRTTRTQVLFIGGDLPRKGGDIVYALARDPAFRDVDFHIVSPNAVEQGDNVHAHRAMTPDSLALRRLVARCDIYIQPTRADMSSLAAMEAGACGLPAIITNVGGIPEVVRHGETGSVLAEAREDLFAAELSAYVANAALVAERGRAARRHIETNFSKERHMSALRAAIACAANGVAKHAQDDAQLSRRAA